MLQICIYGVINYVTLVSYVASIMILTVSELVNRRETLDDGLFRPARMRNFHGLSMTIFALHILQPCDAVLR